MLRLWIAAFLMSFFTQTHATDLILLCTVTAKGKDQSTTTYKRRYEISIEPHYFKVAVDKGSGFRADGEGFPIVISDTRIMFSDDGMVTEYYDRNKMEYFYKNTTTDLEISGPCTTTQPTGKR